MLREGEQAVHNTLLILAPRCEKPSEEAKNESIRSKPAVVMISHNSSLVCFG